MTSQRGIKPVRSQMVPSEIMKTAAIRRPYVVARLLQHALAEHRELVAQRHIRQPHPGGHQPGTHRRRHEHHCQKKQSAADEHRGEELVLVAAEPVADDTDEPEEGDPGDGISTEASFN